MRIYLKQMHRCLLLAAVLCGAAHAVKPAITTAGTSILSAALTARMALRWCRHCALWAWALAFLYAASDEWHQSFVPSRGSSFHDVLIDATGAALGLLLLHGWLLWRQARGLQREH